MCTSFIHKGKDIIVGFNFDVDLKVWDYKVFLAPDRFYIGIKVNGKYHPYHGVSALGNFGNLLYIPENENGKYRRSPKCFRIDLLSEQYINNILTYDNIINILKEKSIINVPNCSMHSLLTNKKGQAVVIEPGIGYKEINDNYFILTNYSVLAPESTKMDIISGDDRYERGKAILESANEDFSVSDALNLLKEVHQEGLWATRVSFVYSTKENKVYYVLDNNFDVVREHKISTK